jgi:hypothetical protein
MKILNILSHKEMQIKIALRFQLTSVKLAIIKKTNNNKGWQGCGGKRTRHTLVVEI